MLFTNQGGIKGALDGKKAELLRARINALEREVLLCTSGWVGGTIMNDTSFHFRVNPLLRPP